MSKIAFHFSDLIVGHCVIENDQLTQIALPITTIDISIVGESVGSHVARRAQELLNHEGKAVKGAKILLLGITYKADIADQRESPAKDVALALENMGANLSFHDPYVAEWTVNGQTYQSQENLKKAASSSDLIVLLQSHREYLKVDQWPSEVPILDTRGVLTTPAAQAL